MSGTAMVTGASRGIGRAVALSLAAEGTTVLAVARSGGDLEALAAEAAARGGGRVVPCVADLADPAGVVAALGGVVAAQAPVSVLVNNAGYGLRGAVEEVPLADARRLFDVNVWSLLRVTQMLLPGMRERRGGTIVNISSVAGLVANPFGGVYCASKFALEALTDALRLELRPWGIRVVLVEPGPVATHFVQAAADASDAVLDNPASPYAPDHTELRQGVRWLHSKAISSEEVARVVLRALHARRPRARYSAHRAVFHVPPLLRRLGPAALLDAILARRMKLTGPR